jgi:hypothetical protein
MKSFAIAAATAALFNAASVLAHGYVSDVTIGGTVYTGYLPFVSTLLSSFSSLLPFFTFLLTRFGIRSSDKKTGSPTRTIASHRSASSARLLATALSKTSHLWISNAEAGSLAVLLQHH